MPIFRVWTQETKAVEMSYDVEAADEDEAADMIAVLKGMSDQEAEQYLRKYGIEAELEAHQDNAEELLLSGVDYWRG